MPPRSLLRLTAVIELLTGLALVLVPSVPVALLFGHPPETPLGSLVARFAGVALLAFGLSCWLTAGDCEGRAATRFVGAVLFYDVAAALLLFYAATALRLSGIVLWPAVFVHTALGVWCAFALAPR